MKHVQAPDPMPDDGDRPWLFLAGAIDREASIPWRSAVIAALSDLECTIIDPVRQAWDASWRNDLADLSFADQTEWELSALDRADLIACWLPNGNRAAVSLLELGMHARSRRLVVGCEPGFHCRGNVQAVCARYGIPCVPDLLALVTIVRQRVRTLCPAIP